MRKIEQIAGFLWWHRRRTGSILLRLAVTGLSYLGGPWTCLVVGLLLFSETAASWLTGVQLRARPAFARRDDEGR